MRPSKPGPNSTVGFLQLPRSRPLANTLLLLAPVEAGFEAGVVEVVVELEVVTGFWQPVSATGTRTSVFQIPSSKENKLTLRSGLCIFRIDFLNFVTTVEGGSVWLATLFDRGLGGGIEEEFGVVGRILGLY